MDNQQTTGFTIWLTGMRRAGKTTLATQLVARLQAAGFRAELLDEDGEAKTILGLDGLGTSKDDHATVVRRLGYVARLVARGGGIAVCAALSPYRDARTELRKDPRKFVEVFVDCEMEALQARDPKGVYRKALAGELTGVPGIDVPYEPPAHAEVVLHTDRDSIDACAQAVFQGLVATRLIAPADFGRLTGGLRPKRSKPAPAARSGGRGKLAAKAAARKAPRKVAARTPNRAKRRK
jgi:adenylylsulfate kinase